MRVITFPDRNMILLFTMKAALMACKSELLCGCRFDNIHPETDAPIHQFLNNWTKDAEYFFQSAIQKT